MKEKIIFFIAIILCVLLPVLAFLALTDGGKPFYAEGGDTLYLRAEVTGILDTKEEYGADGEVLSSDLSFEAKIVSHGEFRGKRVCAVQNYSSYTPLNPRMIEVGDSVVVGRFEGMDAWNFIDFVRSDAIIFLAAAFCALLVVFGRKKGVKTVFSLALTLAAVFFVFVPSVVTGKNIYLWSVLTCLYIIVMTLTVANGISPMSLSASAGCAGGVLVSLAITVVTDAFIHITGNTDSHSVFLLYIGEGIDLRALVYASVMIGSVGAVMDVAVDISASLKELAYKIERPSFRELYRSGIRIGRDVIGTMSNTLVLAYIGGSMSTLLLYIFNNAAYPFYLFNIESIIVEVLKILVGSIGILLTLPLTALVSAWIYTRPTILSEIKSEDADGEYADDEFSGALDAAGRFDEKNK